MKYLSITKMLSMAAIMASLLIFTGSVQAQAVVHYWEVNISAPSDVLTTNQFNLDFQVFSSVPDDQFNVQLVANGSNVVQTKTVGNNGKFGDSGRFTINNVPNGTYTYKVVATNVDDPDASTRTKETATRTVKIAVPDATIVTITRQTIPVTTEPTGTDNAATDGATTVVGDEEIASNLITDTSSASSDTDVQGATSDNRLSTQASIVTLLFIAAIAGAGWLVYGRYATAKDEE